MIDSVQLQRNGAAEIAVEVTPSGARKQTGRFLLGLSLVFLVGVFLSTGLFGFRASVISGGSMQPRWHTGDVVVSRTVDPASLQVGDAVTFGVGGTRIVHRIAAIQESDQGRVFITKGDNNPVSDLPVPAANVEGKVIQSVPVLGRPVLLVRSWLAKLTG